MLQHFSEMLGIQHPYVPYLRGRENDKPKKELTDEGKGRGEKNIDSNEEVETSEKVGTSGKAGRVKKDRADWKTKAMTEYVWTL